MKNLLSISFLLFCFTAFSQTPHHDTIRISDFGLQPGTRENAVPYIQKALLACQNATHPIILFQKGRYDFWPHHCIERVYYEANIRNNNPKRLAILVENLNGLTIDGNMSDFVFHDRMQPLTIDNSQNIIVKNFTVDWDIPLQAQASILSVTDEYIDISINVHESPYIIENGKLFFVGEGWKSCWNKRTMEYEKESLLIAPMTGDTPCLGNGWHNYRAEELSYGIVRLVYPFTRKPAVGNWLVLYLSDRDHAGAFIIDSRNIFVENVDMYHNAGLGFLAQFSEQLTFRNVRCIPNEKKGRILSGHEDGFHLWNCRGDIIVENCVFQGLMDDPINVGGSYVQVVEKVDNFTLRCKFFIDCNGLHWARPGEIVGFIDKKSLQTVATGIVNDFRKIDDEMFEISFQQTVPNRINVGNALENVLENLSWTSNVFIKDSYFKSCRARGILVSTPGKVVIENNIFESSGSAILIPTDVNDWYQASSVNDVLITKNIFRAPCMTSMYQYCEGVISIVPLMSRPDEKTPLHQNIRIVDNEFHLFDYPILYALSVENLVFSENKLIRSYQFEPFHKRKNGLTFEFCKKVTIADNKIEGDVLGTEIKLTNTSKNEVQLKGSFFKFAK